MNALSTDLCTRIDSGTAHTLGTDLFDGKMPDSPAACVAVFVGPGFPLEGNFSYREQNAQIRVRGARGDYAGSHATAEALLTYLHPTRNVTIGGTFYSGIRAMGSVEWVGYDDSDRPIWVINVLASRE